MAIIAIEIGEIVPFGILHIDVLFTIGWLNN